MTNDKLERVALTFCHSGKFACDGRCAPICFEFAGHKPKRCAHAVRVHGDLATAAIAACEAEAGDRERTLIAERDKWKQRAFELECQHGDLKGVYVARTTAGEGEVG